MDHHDRFIGVLSSIHEATLDDGLWPAASGRIDEACGLRGNALVMVAGDSQEDADIIFANICRRGERRRAWERSYFDDYYPQDERVPRLAGLPDSLLTPIADLYTREERKSSATYNVALRAGGYQNGLNVRLDGPEGASVYWALADPIRRGGWASQQIAMIESLLPHVRHFLRVRHALVGAQALNASLLQLLDNTRLAIIQLDRGGRFISANDRARFLLRLGRGLFEQDGFLRARMPADDTRLQQLVANALPRSGPPASGGAMTVTRSPLPSRQVVHVLPVSDRQRDFGTGRVAALVLVVEPGSAARLDAETVAAALGLTETESQVAVALAMGKTVSDVAKERGTTIGTGRFHVKRIHAKLGLSRGTDLVRLVLSLGEVPGLRDDPPK
ncbi:MAG: helix-turn-helix transcriptional regulator [Candidatus Tectomicrobia bacterium]|nr:helix-turn-helix transcriptional regulator [Candidatus Tectomicrobia bacterium]